MTRRSGWKRPVAVVALGLSLGCAVAVVVHEAADIVRRARHQARTRAAKAKAPQPRPKPEAPEPFSCRLITYTTRFVVGGDMIVKLAVKNNTASPCVLFAPAFRPDAWGLRLVRADTRGAKTTEQVLIDPDRTWIGPLRPPKELYPGVDMFEVAVSAFVTLDPGEEAIVTEWDLSQMMAMPEHAQQQAECFPFQQPGRFALRFASVAPERTSLGPGPGAFELTGSQASVIRMLARLVPENTSLQTPTLAVEVVEGRPPRQAWRKRAKLYAWAVSYGRELAHGMIPPPIPARDPEMARPLAELAADPREAPGFAWHPRLEAVRTLGWLGRHAAEAIPTLVSLSAQDPDLHLRVAAAAALGELLLDRSHQPVRAGAPEPRLSAGEPATVVSALNSLLQDGAAEVRREAAFQLAHVDPANASCRPVLVDAVSDPQVTDTDKRAWRRRGFPHLGAAQRYAAALARLRPVTEDALKAFGQLLSGEPAHWRARVVAGLGPDGRPLLRDLLGMWKRDVERQRPQGVDYSVARAIAAIDPLSAEAKVMLAGSASEGAKRTLREAAERATRGTEAAP